MTSPFNPDDWTYIDGSLSPADKADILANLFDVDGDSDTWWVIVPAFEGDPADCAFPSPELLAFRGWLATARPEAL